MADKEPNTVLDVQKVKKIKELPNGNAIFFRLGTSCKEGRSGRRLWEFLGNLDLSIKRKREHFVTQGDFSVT